MSLSQSPLSTSISGTVSDQLDRLEVIVSKIGMNSPEQSLQLLIGFDSASAAMDELPVDAPSRKPSSAQFEALLSGLKNEASRFLRDLGGVQALRSAREQAQPPEKNEWWFLDQYLAARRSAWLRRFLINAGAVLIVLVLLSMLYQRFLAPDPQVVKRYGHEQMATTLMAAGKYQQALDETTQGLLVAPEDPTLLILRATLQETLGQAAEAEQSFQAAEKASANREEFLLARAQAYITLSKFDKAMLDAQEAVRLNPQSANAYLIIGQAHETQGRLQEAIQAYEKAFQAAEDSNQSELAAVARIRLGYVMQQINLNLEPVQTATSTP